MCELLGTLKYFDVISFDVFDTLLLRPYLKPTDLFAKIGGEDFRKDRIAAEQNGRTTLLGTGREEITLDEIYSFIPQWADMKEQELAEERRCLIANSEIVAVWNEAGRLGKKRVIASDMYLPRQFLEGVLREKGIDGWDDFYLSCECGVQKYTGNLFKLLIEEMKVPPYRILHVGDDLNADVKVPESLGLGSWRYPKIRDVFFSENPYAQDFIERHPDREHRNFVGASILAWHLEKCCDGYCTRQKLACLFGGNVIYAYVKWMISDARKRGIKRLLFVARDGYTPKRLVDILAPDFQTEYIYAPRRVSKLIRNGETVREDYLKYIQSLNIDPSITAIVDGNTAYFSSQKLIDACLSSQCMGYYFIRTNDYGRSASYYHLVKGGDPNLYMFLESMYCAPTLPICDVKEGKPVFFNSILPYELVRAENYQHISDAIVRVMQLYEHIGFEMFPKVLFEWLDFFIQNMPLCDELYLTHIKNTIDIEHTGYRSILFRRRNELGKRRLFYLPIWVKECFLDGFILVKKIAIWGCISITLRYRVVHEDKEEFCLGDFLSKLRDVVISFGKWMKKDWCVGRWGTKCYRRLMRHGEYSRR